jgi:hypothetical protein
MLKLKTLIYSLFFIGLSINSLAQVSIGSGAIFNQKAKQLGLQIRLGKTYNGWTTQIKYEKYFLEDDFDLYAIRVGANIFILKKRNYSIYSILELNLTGAEGLDIFHFSVKDKSGGSFGGNLGLGTQFFLDKNQHWKLYTEADFLFISSSLEYFYRRPFQRFFQGAFGIAYNF